MILGRAQTLPRVLEKICTLFDEELDRQRAVRRICEAQGTAARASDMELLEEYTQSLVVLMEDALASEKSRISLLRWIVDHYQLPEEEQTLSDLIHVVPQPWRNRMRGFQSDIRGILTETQRIVTENESFMNRASEKLDASIHDAVNYVIGKPDGYNPEGMDTNDHRQPALLNTVG